MDQMASIEHFMHPSHRLVLAHYTSQTGRFCNVCLDPVQGLFYGCDCCDFYVHPICSQLPEYVRHVSDPHHPLRLRSSSGGCCAVCGCPCTSWRYSNRECDLDIHFYCVEAPFDPATLTQRAVRPCEVSPSQSRSWRPTYGGYGHVHFSGPPSWPPTSGDYGHGVSYSRPPPTYGEYGHGHAVSYGPVHSGVSSTPTYGGYGHGHFSGSPPPWPPHGVFYHPPPPPPPSWPPGPSPHDGYNYIDSHAHSTPYNTHNSVYRPQGSGASSSPWKIRKTMDKIVGGLALGVSSNAIFGMIG